MNVLPRAKLWALTTFILVLLTIEALRTRRRMSHTAGIAGRGTLRVVDRPTFPEHEFFLPGRTFACRVRHSSATHTDEAMLQVRGVALKFADSDYEAPLDIEMNTGQTSVFWTLRLFWRWTSMRLKMIRAAGPPDLTPVLRYFDEYPAALKAARDGVRRNPSSFTRLYYHSGFAIHFRARDGHKRYAKFRLIPADRGPESGLPGRSDLDEVWKTEARLPGDTRPDDYLRQEWAERVNREGANYLLQLQLYEAQPGDTAEVLNSSRPWDESSCPWHDLATVDVREILSAAEASGLHFSIGHQPPSLGLIAAKSIDDYNSINYARRRMALAKHARIFAYRRKGAPSVSAVQVPATAAR
jgi:hypothetical protein